MDRAQWEEHIGNSFITEESYEALTEEEKADAFSDTLSFGTAGIRGKIGLGPNRLNRYTVEKVALGIAHNLEGVEDPLVVIGIPTILLFTPTGVFDTFSALPMQIFSWVKMPNPEFQSITAAAILVLLFILFLMNSVAIYIRNKYSKRF